eukprot:SAG31_NODE_21558_length_546_cov_1.107383_1_plen_64_part_10
MLLSHVLVKCIVVKMVNAAELALRVCLSDMRFELVAAVQSLLTDEAHSIAYADITEIFLMVAAT